MGGGSAAPYLYKEVGMGDSGWPDYTSMLWPKIPDEALDANRRSYMKQIKAMQNEISLKFDKLYKNRQRGAENGGK